MSCRTMTQGMTLEECAQHIGDCVRISRFRGKNNHKGRGKIIGIDGKKVLVLPFGRHRKEELMDPNTLTLWISRNARNQEIKMNRMADVATMDDEVAALLGKYGSNGNGRNPWSNKLQSDTTQNKNKYDRYDRKPIQMEALPPEQITDWPLQEPIKISSNLREKLSNPQPEERATTMNKQEWLSKHCGIVFDCLVNGVQEVFKDPKYKASVETTERILQTLVGDASFIGLDDKVVSNAIPLINAFASEDLDKDAGEITVADLEELMVEKRIIKCQKKIDPIVEIRNGKLDKKEVLQALIGPNGFKSTSELATFVLRELRGMKVE